MQEGCYAGNKRCGHGSPVEVDIRGAAGCYKISGVSTRDIHSRSGDIYRVKAIVREVGQPACLINRRHRDNVVAVIIRRVARHFVIILSLVSCRRDNQDTGRFRTLDRIIHGRGILRTTEACVYRRYIRALLRLEVDNILNTADDAGSVSAALLVQNLDREDGGKPVHSAYAPAVVAHGADNSGNMRSVPVVVARVSAAGHNVYTDQIIGKAVTVIVTAVSRRFSRISPKVAR